MRERLLLLTPLLLGSLTGCMTEKRFYNEMTEAICERGETCYNDVYELVWGDGACFDDRDDQRDDWLELWEACEYDASAARDCLRLWKDDITCNFYPTAMDGYEVCLEVYDCPS